MIELPAWGLAPVSEYAMKHLQEFVVQTPYRLRQKCAVCLRARNLNRIAICKHCFEDDKYLETIRIPTRKTIEYLQREREYRRQHPAAS